MICFSYNSPVSFSLVLDRTKYNLYVSLGENGDEEKLILWAKCRSDVRQKLLFIDSYDRLLGYTKKIKNCWTKKLKIVLFETVQQIAKHNLHPVDAYKNENGVWCMKKLKDVDVGTFIDTIKEGGLVEDTDSPPPNVVPEAIIERPQEVDTFAFETESELGVCVEALVHECHDIDKANELRTVFLKYILGYVEPSVFEKFVEQLEKIGHTRKIIKAAIKAVHSDAAVAVCSTVLDIKLFDTAPELALNDNGCDGDDFSYVGEFVALKDLKLDDCLYAIEDIDNEILKKRVEGGERVVTESTFGQLIEDIVQRISHSPLNKTARLVLVKFAVGMVKEEEVRRFFLSAKTNRGLLEKFIKRVGRGDPLFHVFNRVVLGQQSVEEACEYYACPIEDFNYVRTILNPKLVKKNELLYSSEFSSFKKDGKNG